MDGVGDLRPAGELFGGDEAGLTVEAFAGLAREGALADDEADAGALGVVLGDEVGGDAVGTGAGPGQGRHDDAIGEGEVTGGEGGEQIGMGGSFQGVAVSRR